MRQAAAARPRSVLAKRAKHSGSKRGRGLFDKLSVRGRRIWALIGLAVALAFLEGIGVGMLNPVLQYIQFGAGAKAKGVFGTLLYNVIGALGLPVTLLTLLTLAFIPVLLRQVVYLAVSYTHLTLPTNREV